MLGYLRLIKERVHAAGILPEEWERYVEATGEISRIGYREEIEAAIWVYPLVRTQCPETIYETEHFDERAKSVLDAGGIVYLTPPSIKDALPSSSQAQFTTDFWSVGTFAAQQGGGMGQSIDNTHSLFADFPTEFHTNWQWWPMATQRADILPKRYKGIVSINLQVFEFRTVCTGTDH